MKAARRRQAMRALSVGLHLAVRLLHAPLPAEVLARVRAEAAAGALAEQIIGCLRGNVRSPAGTYGGRVRYALGVQDGWCARGRYAGVSLFRRVWVSSWDALRGP